MLAVSAAVCGSAAKNCSINKPPAAFTWLSISAIDSEIHLEISFLLIGIQIIFDRRSTTANGFKQDSLGAGKHILPFGKGERGGAAIWPDSGVEKNFTGIYIANARDESPIHEQLFYALCPVLGVFKKTGWHAVRIKRFRADSREDARLHICSFFRVQNTHAAKTAAVGISLFCAIGEEKADMAVGSWNHLGIIDSQGASHTQMYHQ